MRKNIGLLINFILAVFTSNLVLSMGLFVFASATTDHKPQITGAASFWLSQEQVSQLKQIANHDNGEAAYRLANFYGFVKNNIKEQISWLRIAASKAYMNSEYNLGILLISQDTRQSKSEGINWLEKAEKKGHQQAKTVIEDYKNRKND